MLLPKFLSRKISPEKSLDFFAWIFCLKNPRPATGVTVEIANPTTKMNGAENREQRGDEPSDRPAEMAWPLIDLQRWRDFLPHLSAAHVQNGQTESPCTYHMGKLHGQTHSRRRGGIQLCVERTTRNRICKGWTAAFFLSLLLPPFVQAACKVGHDLHIQLPTIRGVKAVLGIEGTVTDPAGNLQGTPVPGPHPIVPVWDAAKKRQRITLVRTFMCHVCSRIRVHGDGARWVTSREYTVCIHALSDAHVAYCIIHLHG